MSAQTVVQRLRVQAEVGLFDVPAGHQYVTCSDAADAIEAANAAATDATAKLRNVIAHATGGALSDGADLSLNEISVRISQHQNRVYGAGKESANAAAEGLAKALEGAASWFDDYAAEHYRKAKNAPSAGEQHGSEVKGKTNADRAAELRTALAAYRTVSK